MNRLLSLICLCALGGAISFPILRAVASSPRENRLYFTIWLIAAGIVALGAAFPVRAPRRVQSWACAVLLWSVALMFLAAAFLQMARWYPDG